MSDGGRAVVVTGPPGAGKTSVLERLTTLLEIDGVRFGALESEQLGWGCPLLSGEPWLRQVRAVLALQREAGRRLFLIAATTETSQELAALVEAIAAERVVSVLLTAPPAVVASRLQEREPDTWPGKPRLVEHARRLAVSMARLEGIDLRFDTDGADVDAVAAALRDGLRTLRVIP